MISYTNFSTLPCNTCYKCNIVQTCQKLGLSTKKRFSIIFSNHDDKNSSFFLLQLRYLQTLNGISAENNSTIIFPVPIDIMSSFMQVCVWSIYILYDIELSLLNNNICSIPWITIQPLNNSNKCSSISFYNINNNNNKHLKFKLKTLPHLHRYFSRNIETCPPELAHCAVDNFPLCMMIFELEELLQHVPSHKIIKLMFYLVFFILLSMCPSKGRTKNWLQKMIVV